MVHRFGFPDPSEYIDGARVYPSDLWGWKKPVNTLLPYHVIYWCNNRMVYAEFESKQRTPKDAFVNFYHLVKEFQPFQVDGLSVKRLTPPMSECDLPSKQYHKYPAQNTYRVVETGEIFFSSNSDLLQSYADFRKKRLEQPMDWE